VGAGRRVREERKETQRQGMLPKVMPRRRETPDAVAAAVAGAAAAAAALCWLLLLKLNVKIKTR